MTPSGGGTVDVLVGTGASGTLDFTGGAYQIGSTLSVGLEQSAQGLITGLLRFQGSDVTFAPSAGQVPSVIVGQGGTGSSSVAGYLDLLAGATLDVAYQPGSTTGPAPGLVVGDEADAVGQVLVAGSGSSLLVSGPGSAAILGRSGGQGTLAFLAGGVGEMTGLTAGTSAGIGQVYIAGAGSELVLSANYGDGASGPVGGAVFGSEGGAGFLGIASGADLILRPGASASRPPSLTFGADQGSYGYGILNGVGSSLTFEPTGSSAADAGHLTIGGAGEATLIVDNSAEVTMSGTGSRLDIGAEQQGRGFLQILDGSAVRITGTQSATVLSSHSTASSTVRLSGSDSLLAAGSFLTIAAGLEGDDPSTASGGGGGTALLEIGQGSEVTAGTTVLGQGGKISGAGRLTTQLTAFGEISPGGDDAVGTFTISGSLDLEASAMLLINIDAFEGGGADQIILSGPLTGTLSPDQITVSIDPDITTGGAQPVTILATTGALQNTDFTFLENGFQLRVYSQVGVGLLLELAGAQITGTPDADTLTGTSGDDQFLASEGPDLLIGGAGQDLVDFSDSGAVSINLFSNVATGDLAEGDQFSEIEDILGGNRDDRLTGTEVANSLTGGGGDDALIGRGGGDDLSGGSGNDTLFGGAGNDQLSVTSGSNTLSGGAGDDDLTGGTGSDLLRGEGGGDTLDGQSGSDRLDGGSGNDTLYGEGSGDLVEGGPGIDLLYGGVGTDSLYGQGRGDELYGGNGSDELFGGAGGDTLFGEAGSDTLTGGSGADTLFGGSGADRFVYTTVLDATADASEVIGDFGLGQDVLDFSAFDSDPQTSGRQPLEFIGSAPFSSQPGQLRTGETSDPTVEFVEIDLDGDAVAELRVELTGEPSLTASDFEL